MVEDAVCLSLAERSAAHMCDACTVQILLALCLQGRPALVFGDAVYLRLAARPQEEAAACLVSQRGTQALLALPPGFLEVLKKVGLVGKACPSSAKKRFPKHPHLDHVPFWHGPECKSLKPCPCPQASS